MHPEKIGNQVGTLKITPFVVVPISTFINILPPSNNEGLAYFNDFLFFTFFFPLEIKAEVQTAKIRNQIFIQSSP